MTQTYVPGMVGYPPGTMNTTLEQATMNKEIPFNLDDCRPFNLEHAKEGAPLILTSGAQVRLVCFNLFRDDNYTLLGIINKEHSYETPVFYNKLGHTMGGRGSFSILMAPLAYVENRPVHVGDVLQWFTMTGFSRYSSFTASPAFKLKHGREYRWPKKILKKEVWQPRFRNRINGSCYISGAHFDTKLSIEERFEKELDFVEAVKTDEYTVEE